MTNEKKWGIDPVTGIQTLPTPREWDEFQHLVQPWGYYANEQDENRNPLPKEV